MNLSREKMSMYLEKVGGCKSKKWFIVRGEPAWNWILPTIMQSIRLENALAKVKDEKGMKRLMDLGLSYLTLDRAASTLSTGERQRMQLAGAVRNRTTGVLYVLDEPSIGLHPSNIVGLNAVMHDMVADGNSVVVKKNSIDNFLNPHIIIISN